MNNNKENTNPLPSLQNNYSQETQTVLEAQRLAHEISFAPVVFQVARLMLKSGILQMLADSRDGMTLGEISDKVASDHALPPVRARYAVQCLLESSLTAGTVLLNDGKYTSSKAGWFLLNDPLVKINLDFNHDVNYLGLYHLEEALMTGKPAGLKVFGKWKTIYEGLSSLPQQVQRSWFAFDHYYSDQSFAEALSIVFAGAPRTLLDVGGNTGRWAMQCVRHDENIRVTVMDLPQQITLMQKATEGQPGAERISGYGCNLLDSSEQFPAGFDVIWLSQFLDCFSEEEATNILIRAAAAMTVNTRLYIMETFWDRQRFTTAAYCLTQISLYFTAMANGNSKMYHSLDMLRCIGNAGLAIETIHDGIGKGHSIVVCKLNN
ncbi:MAG: SAM-dependent methyltransferase [Dysgonamonadaceae bacterium]|nr:SAM-dependent methyltransferase [Dysgonamonadaceae bacterium]